MSCKIPDTLLYSIQTELWMGCYVITFPICICCDKHSVQFLLLHQAADLFDCPLQAGDVLSVAPDKVLPAQVDPQVWTTFSWAQLGLKSELRNNRPLFNYSTACNLRLDHQKAEVNSCFQKLSDHIVNLYNLRMNLWKRGLKQHKYTKMI